MGFQVSLLFLGGVDLNFFCIPDSVILLHSRLDTILEESYAFNKKQVNKNTIPPPRNKNSSAEGGGSHLQIL